jgi:isoquinoline 1-oxidoreductase subunit alpha
VIELHVNGQNRGVDSEPDAPLLWAQRDDLNLTGTQFGGGIAACCGCISSR